MTGVIKCLSLVLFASISHAQDATPIKLSLTEPDWLELTDGRWSPWVKGEDGERHWNPMEGFNSWVASVPDHDRAWPALSAWAQRHRELVEVELPLVDALWDPRTDEGREAKKKALELISREDVRAATDDLRAILSQPNLGRTLHIFVDEPADDEYRLNPSVLLLDLSHLGVMKKISVLLHHDGLARLEAGDPDAYLDIQRTALNASDIVDEFPMPFAQIQSFVHFRLVLESAKYAIYNLPESLTEEHLAALDAMIAGHEPQRFHAIGASLDFHDGVRRLMSAAGQLFEQDKADIATLPPVHNLFDDLPEQVRELLAVHDEVAVYAEERSRLPLDIGDPSCEQLGNRLLGGKQTIRGVFLSLHTPGYGSAAAQARAVEQEAIATRLVIAVHRHRLRHGRLPESVDAIDDDLLTVRPLDGFSGEQLQYRLSDEHGFMIYGFGPDGDDDGGVFVPRLSLATEERDGDVVLYPMWWIFEE